MTENVKPLTENRTFVYCDGGCLANGTDHSQMYYSFKIGDGPVVKRLLDTGTNNRAEYIALIVAMSEAVSLSLSNVTFFTDSQLIVNQVNNVWLVRDTTLRRFWQIVFDYIAMSGGIYRVVYAPREQIVAVLGH